MMSRRSLKPSPVTRREIAGRCRPRSLGDQDDFPEYATSLQESMRFSGR